MGRAAGGEHGGGKRGGTRDAAASRERDAAHGANLVHAGVGKKQRGVIVGDGGRRRVKVVLM